MCNAKILLCLIFSVLILSAGVVPAYGQNDVLSSIDDRIERFQERYGIPFKYDGFPPGKYYIKFLEVSPKEYRVLNDYLILFEEEINKYPRGFFKGRDVRGIGLVNNLFSGETPAQGLYSSSAHIMFFDISRFGDNKSQQRHSIHHEIYHMMSQQDQGLQVLSDEKWASFNNDGFSYGEQNKSLRDANPINPYAPNQLGFVTYYAMKSIEEDQAEVFACLMQKNHRDLIEKWMQKDPALKKKIEAIKYFSAEYNYEMDEKYWN
ncbi:MAG: putative zinc-binding metallopeptidase [Candidatus Omnitrophica bacterium]|nr:putative zinc-binding metallopeptidase [Candidatus Omnitrophota bacterium]MBU1997716.1 putative zinc-binding metallopeptidase [Candidatus Omnitrophota bacterium]MBU4333090.1 putative zinc-binding metallopeptidase [Candidatus Omnitrophota bacterium]